MRACLHGNPDFERGISPNLHVFFPRVITCKSRFAVAGIASGRRSALSRTSDGESLQEFSIEPYIELLGPTHPLDVILILALKPNFYQVFALNRKVVVNRYATSRPQRQIFALAIFLQDVQRDLESVDFGVCGRKTRGQAGDLAGYGQISFQMRCRNRKRICKVIETSVRGLVARKK